MIVLVDTTVRSLAFRRRQVGLKEQVLIEELAELIRELRATIIGPIRQEILSGIADLASFEKVRERLSAFDDLEIEPAVYVDAARAYNTCRQKGVQGSQIDFLICAVARRYAAPVFTTDKDFTGYARHLDVELYSPRSREK